MWCGVVWCGVVWCGRCGVVGVSPPLDRGGGAVSLKLIGKSAAEAGSRDRPEQKLMNLDRSSWLMASRARQK